MEILFTDKHIIDLLIENISKYKQSVNRSVTKNDKERKAYIDNISPRVDFINFGNISLLLNLLIFNIYIYFININIISLLKFAAP